MKVLQRDATSAAKKQFIPEIWIGIMTILKLWLRDTAEKLAYYVSAEAMYLNNGLYKQ